MADIRYRCPNCAEKLCVHEAAAEMEVPCPHCNHAAVVPAPAKPGNLLSINLRFRCPACEKKMSVDIAHAGEIASCPECAKPFAVPDPLSDPTTSPSGASALSKEEVAFMMGHEDHAHASE